MSIGSTVHFHDVEITHNDDNILESKVYYDRNIDLQCNLSDEPMENKAEQLHAVLYRAVRCCSNVMKFNDERRHIQLSFLSSGLTPEFIQSGGEHFFSKFGLSKNSFSYLLNEDEYCHLRQRIIQDTEQQMTSNKQRKQENQHTLFIPCPIFLDHQQLDNYKKCIIDWWKKYYGNEPQTKHILIKWIEQTSKNVTNSDLLVNKRPPIRLLTLSKKY
jgi:hypothetical protein